MVKLACILQYTHLDMYKMWTFRAIKLLILCVFTLYWGISHAGTTGIKDSSHDLTQGNIGANFKYRTSQTCVFCHTPHGANTDVRADTYFDTQGGPIGYVNGTDRPLLLWNRSLSNALDYKLYKSSTSVLVTQVRVYSLLCLSCHDGVGALNVVQNFPGDGTGDGFGGIAFAGGGAKPDQIGDVFDGQINIGGRTPGGQTYVDLRDDHPISVDYATARSQDASGLMPISGSGENLWVGDPKIKLFGGYVECTSCHDPHNEGDESNGNKYPFLYVDNAGSYLCIQCHLK